MRTKIGKRIGPVPSALVAVLALAAFISVGIWLVPSNGQTAEAQEFTGTAVTEDKCETDGQDDGAVGSISGGGCMTTGDSVDVVFNDDRTTGANVFVYVTGGSKYPGVRTGTGTNYGDTNPVPDDDQLGREGVDVHPLDLQAFGVDKLTITVTRDMADSKGEVYLWAYTVEQTLTAESTFLSGDEAYAVRVDFVGAPVAYDGKAKQVDPTPDDNNPSDSKLQRTVSDPCKVALAAADDDNNAVSSEADLCSTLMVDNTSWENVTFDFKDAYGRPVTGNVTVMLSEHSAGAEGIKLTNETNQLTSYRVNMGMAGLFDVPSKSTLASFRVKVTATIDSETGTLTQTKYIYREGNADSISAMAYECHEGPSGDMDDVDTMDTDESLTACHTGEKAADRKAPGSLKAGNSVFYIKGVVKDVSGNPLERKAISIKSADVTNPGKFSPLTVTGMTNAKGEYTSSAIGIGADPKYGMHEIEVSTGSGSRMRSTTVTVVIGGDAMSISVECMPDPIPTATGQTDCVASVIDANGNAPSNLDFTSEPPDNVLVSVRDKDAQVIGAVGGRVNLDAMGMASFSVLLGQDFPEGGSVTVNVSATIDGEAMQSSTSLMYGEADGTTAPGMDDELGATSGVGVGFNRGGAMQVHWTKADNAMGYIIVAINVANSMVDGEPVVLNDGNDETENISGLTPGTTYDIYVIATGSGGMYELGEPFRVMATR